MHWHLIDHATGQRLAVLHRDDLLELCESGQITHAEHVEALDDRAGGNRTMVGGGAAPLLILRPVRED